MAEQSAESDQPRREVPPEIRGVSFPVARRGYERSAVDTYVARVIDLIDDLEATRSPEAAVKHALRAKASRAITGPDRAPTIALRE